MTAPSSLAGLRPVELLAEYATDKVLSASADCRVEAEMLCSQVVSSEAYDLTADHFALEDKQKRIHQKTAD